MKWEEKIDRERETYLLNSIWIFLIIAGICLIGGIVFIALFVSKLNNDISDWSDLVMEILLIIMSIAWYGLEKRLNAIIKRIAEKQTKK